MREQSIGKFEDAVLWNFQSDREHAQQVSICCVSMVGGGDENIAGQDSLVVDGASGISVWVHEGDGIHHEGI
eukprot:3481508-Prorocentrum_lima.AAC.1